MMFAARLCDSRVQYFHPAGSLSQSNRTVFETLLFCLSLALQSLSEATETRAGPRARSAPPLQVPEVPRWPASSWVSRAETGFRHLPRRWLASSPEAKWLGGIQTAAGVRCGPSQLPCARKGDSGWICNSQPTNSKREDDTEGPSRVQKARSGSFTRK